jgi:hypothetical protein
LSLSLQGGTALAVEDFQGVQRAGGHAHSASCIQRGNQGEWTRTLSGQVDPMGMQRKAVHTPGSVSPQDEALLAKACPKLHDWPRRWHFDVADLPVGEEIVAIFRPFLIELLHELSHKTFSHHRDNLWLLGGEIIRRRYDEPGAMQMPVKDLMRQMVGADGGPLIWPRISEAEQVSVDATSRKLARFLARSGSEEKAVQPSPAVRTGDA